MDGQPSLPSACFVTPSYSGDFERCRLLVESREACAPNIDHFIIVDAPDLAQFRSLASRRTTIVDSREILDAELHKLWGNNGWWFGHRVLPLRGWITQQLRKLAIRRIVDHDILINLDSDVVFMRPFSQAQLMSGDRLALFEVDFRNDEIGRWSDQSASVLGIAKPKMPNNYVSTLIGWWSQVTKGLTDRIENEAGMPWQIALARQRSFSECMLYGTYARHVIGLDRTKHFSDGRPLVRLIWGANNIATLNQLLEELPEVSVAVMIHSKDGIDPSEYEKRVRSAWSRV